jgi:hypothetical protein
MCIWEGAMQRNTVSASRSLTRGKEHRWKQTCSDKFSEKRQGHTCDKGHLREIRVRTHERI